MVANLALLDCPKCNLVCFDDGKDYLHNCCLPNAKRSLLHSTLELLLYIIRHYSISAHVKEATLNYGAEMKYDWNYIYFLASSPIYFILDQYLT